MPLANDLARNIHSCRAIVAESTGFPSWFKDVRRCSVLDNHLIKHCGSIKTTSPFQISRQNPSGSYFLACHKGLGQFLCNDQWVDLKPGQACLLPPHTYNSLRAPEGNSWSYSWIRFHQAHGKFPGHSLDLPIVGSFSSKTLRHALDGLFEEASCATPSKSDLHHWIELINNHVARFHSNYALDPRLKVIWETASGMLSNDWSLETLASVGHLGIEQFRRLNQKQLQRSPIKHLTHLRMTRASSLLLETNEKISTIASLVGYDNAFHFSNAFQKHFGQRPSDYRRPVEKSST